MSEPAPERVRHWLSGLAGASRPFIRATVGAGVTVGLATIAQMVLLAWIVHQGVMEKQPVAELAPWFAALVVVLFIRAAGQGLQGRFAAR
ncbi:MAG: hypothetical protein B7X58_06325, partial [Marinobacter sp. 34-60-7]